ncbi:PREDICTED: putative F-box protein At4g10190 [Camelina sativa]|uniref:F-box protein At4g10190 n=1 Tax=Camelina sativa TaxID=90675 RepID=A0ABM0YKQ2_CAMSA|nr:PREDICTED: putative F-box protein At4g10190 [Camelina sativa]XP_010502499.1 PREDICTED: putative F-box protein At4g10190 [Camelina sativa]XP_010502500.1 PREDICTED: putative F-box protein At4g10190 [Camelina sativa]
MLIDFRVYSASIDLSGVQDENNVVKVTRQLSLKDPLSTSPKEVDIREVFHCDSILLCTTEDDRLVLWNPCSGEKTRWMNNPVGHSLKKYNYYALGKSSSSNKYKILRIRQHGTGILKCLVEYEIYDFTSHSWRVVGETSDWSIHWLMHRGMSVNVNTYWLASSHIPDSQKDFLLSFDFSTERFQSMSLPVDDFSYDFMALSVTREEHKLCLLGKRYPYNDTHVWIATKIESTGAMSWSKFLTLKRSIYRQLILCSGMNFLADPENNVLVCPGRQQNSNSFLHIFGKDKHMGVDHHDAGSKCLLVCYVPTLAQIQQGS